MNRKPTREQIIYLFGIFVLCILSFSVGFWLNETRRSSEEKMIAAAYRVISRDGLFNEQSDPELSFSAVRGMLGAINDPYAELIEPKAAQNFTKTFAGQTGVVGLYAENQAGQVVITIVFPDSPAEKAGLHIGDVILAINDVTLDQATDSSETGLMIRGAPGTTVRLSIQRQGQILEFNLVRQVREFVSSRMLPGGVAYISLSAYNRTATQQMKDALTGLLTQNPTGLIWDLRNNEGGDMQAAQEIISLFIEDGPLFSAEMTDDRVVEFKAKGDAIAPKIPLVVLTDKTTYSAAETSAAAIVERGRGTTIGSRTYGKGLIQATVFLLKDTLLQMTVAKWLSPDGVWYQETGVPPQIEVFDDPETDADEVLERAIEALSAR
jgi:carboxyl-terminal processing protease